MGMMAAVVRELVAAGVTGDALVTAVERIEEAGRPIRSAAAERMIAYRKRKREDEDASRVTHGDGSGFPDKEIPPTPPKEINPSAKTPVRARRKISVPLDAEWHPSPASRERARALGFTENRIDEIAEDLRVWAHGKGEVRADWDATFDGFVRRDAKERRGGTGPPQRSRAVNGFAAFALDLAEEDHATAPRNDHQPPAGTTTARPGVQRVNPQLGVLDAERSDAAGGAYAVTHRGRA